MGRFFSDAVEKALRDIYYQERLGRGKEGFQLLEQASAAGDGDALYSGAMPVRSAVCLDGTWFPGGR